MRIISLLVFISCVMLAPFSSAASDYDRGQWRHWIDSDRDCQDTRQEMLSAMELPASLPRSSSCMLRTGIWIDEYTGELFTESRKIDVDHVIPLAYAHSHGAMDWTSEQREEFANDFDNLRVVGASVNRSKGSKGPSGYMPSGLFGCDYAGAWLNISDKYNLIIEENDMKAISGKLFFCLIKT